MNNKTRKQISEIFTAISDLRCELDEIMEEERSKFDNLTEGLQASEMGQRMEESADELDDAISSIDDALSTLESLMDS